MRSIKPLLAVLGLTVSASAMAVPVTDVFTVTLPGPQAGYDAGHVFSVTVSYDDAGTSMHDWNDGANGIAEAGQGDDALEALLLMSGYFGYTLFSDAQVSVAGLEADPFSAPLDIWNTNRAWYYEYQDPAAGGYWYLDVQQDDLNFTLYSVSDGFQGGDAYQYLTIFQYFVDSEATKYVHVVGDSFATRQRITTSVPEPGTLAMLGLGVIGVALYGRRKQRNRQDQDK